MLLSLFLPLFSCVPTTSQFSILSSKNGTNLGKIVGDCSAHDAAVLFASRHCVAAIRHAMHVLPLATISGVATRKDRDRQSADGSDARVVDRIELTLGDVGLPVRAVMCDRLRGVASSSLFATILGAHLDLALGFQRFLPTTIRLLNGYELFAALDRKRIVGPDLDALLDAVSQCGIATVSSSHVRDELELLQRLRSINVVTAISAVPVTGIVHAGGSGRGSSGASVAFDELVTKSLAVPFVSPLGMRVRTDKRDGQPYSQLEVVRYFMWLYLTGQWAAAARPPPELNEVSDAESRRVILFSNADRLDLRRFTPLGGRDESVCFHELGKQPVCPGVRRRWFTSLESGSHTAANELGATTLGTVIATLCKFPSFLASRLAQWSPDKFEEYLRTAVKRDLAAASPVAAKRAAYLFDHDPLFNMTVLVQRFASLKEVLSSCVQRFGSHYVLEHDVVLDHRIDHDSRLKSMLAQHLDVKPSKIAQPKELVHKFLDESEWTP
uniref:Uncharacterized protein n=1 Tax=Sexangularia sp. CB-2014 TaxID=1486929 RepID=A0A7S1YB80_9EUKA